VTSAADVIVIGAGVVGAACARELAMAGHGVLVLERDTPAAGVTAAGMGHIVVMDDSPAQLALTALSRGLLTALAPELAPDVEFDQCGTLWIAETDAEFAAARAKLSVLDAAGVTADMLDADALAEAEPGLRPGLAGALRVPDDGVLYQPALTRWLLSEAAAHGARIRTRCGIVRLAAGGVRVGEEMLASGHVIVAAGPESVELLPELPVIPRKGHLAVTSRMPALVRHQLVELGYLRSAHTMSRESVAFNIQPRRSGQLLIGSSRELAGYDRQVNHALLGAMLERAISFMPAVASLDVLRVWTGCRPATPDKLPLIGPCPERASTWVATGHEGLGITTALGTAALLRCMLGGEPPPMDVSVFDPGRAMARAAGDHA